MAIQEGSKLRVDLPFIDHQEDGTEVAIPLDGVVSKGVRIIKPDGTDLEAPTLEIEDAAAGLAYWEGVVDQAGVWRAQGSADGYLSDWVTWRVEAGR